MCVDARVADGLRVFHVFFSSSFFLEDWRGEYTAHCALGKKKGRRKDDEGRRESATYAQTAPAL